MPRQARLDRGGLCYHVFNRGNERQQVFTNDLEYAHFIQLLQGAKKHQAMRILAFCLMPNHFHLCLWPHGDGNLGKFMQWLMTTHVSHFRKSKPGVGHVWQGRFKAFATQTGEHLSRVLRYIERNPVRAKLCDAAENWPWSSAFTPTKLQISEWPIPRPANWIENLRIGESETELSLLRNCLLRSLPHGNEEWIARERLGD
jgi:putative transposase